jgi:hypothetical protein
MPQSSYLSRSERLSGGDPDDKEVSLWTASRPPASSS